MNDNEKALMHQFEMASHSEGYAQFLYQLRKQSLSIKRAERLRNSHERILV